MCSKTRFLIAVTFTLTTTLGAACSRSPVNSLAPFAPGPGGDAAADGSTLKVTPPPLLSPVGGVEVTDLDPNVVFGRATPLYATGATPQFQYELEIYDEDGQRVYARTLDGAGSTISHELAVQLNFNEAHTWRVRARMGAYVGPWSAAASFRTFEDAIAANSCAHIGNNPLGIVECRRAQFEHMDDEELVEFLKSVAFDLNRAGVPGGPWGVLIKTIGGNCQGYSCDILCTGQGDDQNQYDVLGDAEGDQIPGFRELDEDIVVRDCEFIQ